MVKKLVFGDIITVRKSTRKERRYIFCGKVNNQLLLFDWNGESHILVDSSWFRDKHMNYVENIENPEMGHNDRERANIYRDKFNKESKDRK